MILLVAIVLSLLVALLRGGKLVRLTTVSFRCGWVALLAFALQILVIYFPLPTGQGLLGPRTLLLLGSYALLVVVVAMNKSLPGLIVVGVGLLLNLAVMLANGGFMTITPEALQQAGLAHLALGEQAGARVLNAKDIILPRESTYLWILSDILILPPPVGTVFSIGDVLLAVGAFIFFQRSMCIRTARPARSLRPLAK